MLVEQLEASQEVLDSMKLVKYYQNHKEILNEWARLAAQLSSKVVCSQESSALE
jgi:hypothetical protein